MQYMGMPKHLLPRANGLSTLVVVCLYLGLPYSILAGENPAKGKVFLQNGSIIVVRPNGVDEQEYNLGWRLYVIGKQGLFRDDYTLLDNINAKNGLELRVNLVGKELFEAASILKTEMRNQKIIPKDAEIIIDVYKLQGKASSEK